jgi:signal transduction histidine kinase
LAGLLTIARTRPKDSGSDEYFTPWDVELLSGVGRLDGDALARHQLARQLVATDAARLAAEAATEQRDEFMSIASHELRTPLTTIIANTQLLERNLAAITPTVEQAQPGKAASMTRMLDRSLRRLQRLNRLVSDLLDVSRIAPGKLDLQFAPTDLRAVVREDVDEHQAAWPQRSIVLNLPPDAAIVVLGDADRIGQVVTNFLSNALKYSPPESPVQLQVTLQDGCARVAVRDQGPGISPEQGASL